MKGVLSVRCVVSCHHVADKCPLTRQNEWRHVWWALPKVSTSRIMRREQQSGALLHSTNDMFHTAYDLLPPLASASVPPARIIDSPVRVQHRPARRFTSDGLIKDGGQVLTLLERGVERADGHDGASSFDTGRRPYVPRETHAIPVLYVVHV